MQRFFVPPSSISRDLVQFEPAQAHQIHAVLRLRPGDRVAVLDNAGWTYDVELTAIDRDTASGVVLSRRLAEGEPRTKITLYHGLLKGDKNELVLQKCTELGVSAFVPTICSRSVVGSMVGGDKLLRWQRIVVEAAEQSGRGRLPVLQPATLFGQACEQIRGLAFIAWERETETPLRQALARHVETAQGKRPFAISLFVGPEGGFDEDEVARARSARVIPVGLGPRILRAETAAIVTAALILSHVGDLD